MLDGISKIRTRLTATTAALVLAVPATLGLLSADAAGTVTAAIALRGPASAQYGTTQTVTGVLWRYQTSTRIPGAIVYLQRTIHGDGNWATVASTTTANDGTFSVPVKQLVLYDYRALYRGSSTYTAALSGVVHTVTIPVIAVRVLGNSGGERLAVGATVYPAPPNGKTVFLQRQDNAQVWRTIGFGRISDYNSGGWHRTGQTAFLVLLPPSVASYRLVVPAQGGYAEAVSVVRRHAHDVFRPPIVTATGGSPGTTVNDPLPTNTYNRTMQIRGGALAVGWFDLDVSSCTRLSYHWTSLGPRVRMWVRSGDTTLHTQESTAAGNDFNPVFQPLSGQQTVRFEFSDVTSTALQVNVHVKSACTTW